MSIMKKIFSKIISNKIIIGKTLMNLQKCAVVAVVILFFGIGISVHSLAQQKDSNIFIKQHSVGPVILEPFIGTKGTLVALNFSKPIIPKSRFGVFVITEFYGVYKKEKQFVQNQYMGQAHITYEFLRNLTVSSGVILDQVDGFRPTAGIQYRLKKGDFFFLAAPRIDLTQTHNGELMGFIEYTPLIKNDWKLYSRFQGLYNRDLEHGVHAFSYMRARLGTSYKTYRFGIGANFSTYGPQKFHNNEFGLFIGTLLF